MQPQFSILIITYNRCLDTLELVKSIYQQKDWSNHLLEILILNNNSDTSYATLIDWLEQHPDFPVNYIDHPENLGVAKGRNYLFKLAKGAHFLFLDDDTYIDGDQLFSHLTDLINDDFIQDHKVGITTLEVFYSETNTMQESAFPHKNKSKYLGKRQFLTYYFTGCAHLVDARVIKDVDLYPEDFFYGMEEYDFSFRVLDAGWNIAYDDRIRIYHKESPLGRLPKINQWFMMWENKCKVAYRYLPKTYYHSVFWAWMIHLMKMFKAPLKILKKGQEIRSNIKKEKRRPLSKATLTKLKKLDARLHY